MAISIAITIAITIAIVQRDAISLLYDVVHVIGLGR